ncbi:MAG: serine hydrolase domain-containing protein [Luteibaculaceae bacterium]
MIKNFLFFSGIIFLLQACSIGNSMDSEPLLVAEEEVVEDIYIAPAFAVDTLSKFFENWHKRDGFNGVVHVLDNGNTAFNEAYGFSDLRNRRDSLTTESLFQIASVSKPITAAAIAVLHEQGKLNLNDDITVYLPDFPYAGISIKSLLNHTHGLFNYTYFADEAWIYKDSLLTMDKLYELVLEKKPPVIFRPNRRFNYSNTGYVMLAKIVEKTAGVDFQEFLQEMVYKPSGVQQANVMVMGLRDYPEQLVPGFDKFNKYYPPTYLNTVYGDKGVLATAKDISLFAEAFVSGKIVSDSLAASFLLPAVKTGDLNKFYGFGWRVIKLEGNRTIPYHTGWWQGYKSLLVTIPEYGLSITILSNSTRNIFPNVEEVVNLIETAFQKNSLETTDTSQHLALQ